MLTNGEAAAIAAAFSSPFRSRSRPASEPSTAVAITSSRSSRCPDALTLSNSADPSAARGRPDHVSVTARDRWARVDARLPWRAMSAAPSSNAVCRGSCGGGRRPRASESRPASASLIPKVLRDRPATARSSAAPWACSSAAICVSRFRNSHACAISGSARRRDSPAPRARSHWSPRLGRLNSRASVEQLDAHDRSRAARTPTCPRLMSATAIPRLSSLARRSASTSSRIASRSVQIAFARGDDAQVFQRFGNPRLVPHLAIQRKRFFVAGLGALVVAGGLEQHAETAERLGAQRGRRACAMAAGRLQTLLPLAQMPAHPPEPAQVGGEGERRRRLHRAALASRAPRAGCPIPVPDRRRRQPGPLNPALRRAAPESTRRARRVPRFPLRDVAASCSSPNSRIVSSMVKRGSSASSSLWRSRLFCTRLSIPSSRSMATPEPASATASAPAKVQPPAKTASRAKSACSPASSRSWLQAIVARSVCCRSGRSRAPPVSSGRRFSSRASSAAGASRRTRAAASSMASGSPSSRWQIAAIAAAFSVGHREIGFDRLGAARGRAAPPARPAPPPERCASRRAAAPAAPRETRARRAAAAARGWWPGLSRRGPPPGAPPSSGRDRQAPAPGCRAPAASVASADARPASPAAAARPARAPRARPRSLPATSAGSVTAASGVHQTPSGNASRTFGGGLHRQARLARCRRARSASPGGCRASVSSVCELLQLPLRGRSARSAARGGCAVAGRASSAAGTRLGRPGPTSW